MENCTKCWLCGSKASKIARGTEEFALCLLLDRYVRNPLASCLMAVTSEDIAAAQREECNRDKTTHCGIGDCTKCPNSSVFDATIDNIFKMYGDDTNGMLARERPIKKQEETVSGLPSAEKSKKIHAGYHAIHGHVFTYPFRCVSADELKETSTYRCALPGDRKAMLIRHYELDIAKLSEQLNRSTVEIKALKVANKKLQSDNDELREEEKSRLSVQKLKHFLEDYERVTNRIDRTIELLSLSYDALLSINEKWRLLEKGEPYMKGDKHQVIVKLPVDDWEWVCMDNLAGDKHDGKDIVIRKITFE